MSDKFIFLFYLFKRHKKTAILGGIFMLINVLLLLPIPLLTIYLIDVVLPNKDIRLLLLICILALTVVITNSIFSILQRIYFQKFNELVLFKIQVYLFEKVQFMPPSIRKKMQTGYLMSRIIDDPNRLHSLLIESLFSIIKDILIFIVGLTLVFYINWELACLCLILLPIYLLIYTQYNKAIKKNSEKYYEKRALVSKKVQETLSLHNLFYLFNAQKYETIRMVKYLKEATRTNMYTTWLAALSSALLGIISNIGPILVISYGIYQIIHNKITLGELIAFNSYLGYLFGPTARLVSINLNIQQSLAAWERIYEYMNDFEKYEPVNNKALTTNQIKENIILHNVSFSYDHIPILKNINLKIPVGSTVAILGQSGCGKSTLISLLTQFNTEYSGEILIDHINIKDYNIKKLRDQMAVVTQEPSLFHDTISNNIRIGKNNIEQKKIIQACRIVNIHDFIETLPNKYETILDERANNISIGQKQRIALARAIVRDPQILILDEPTSGLDVETEHTLYMLLEQFIKKRTTFIITHHLEIPIKFDLIFTIEEGNIVNIRESEYIKKYKTPYSN